jgi:hypothetical protein
MQAVDAAFLLMKSPTPSGARCRALRRLTLYQGAMINAFLTIPI